MTAIRSSRLQVFAALSGLLLCVEWAITRTAVFQRGGIVPAAVLFDLMVGLPVVFGLLVLRPAKRSAIEVAPVVALGTMAATLLLSSRPEMGWPLRVAGGASEALVLAYLVRRLGKARGQLRDAPSDDLLMRVAALTDPVLRLAGAELAVLYYALVGPWMKRPLRRDSTAREFSYTDGGLSGLLLALGVMTVTEALVVHLVLQASRPRAAWLATAVHAYGIVWLVAAYQAARLRPVVLTPRSLLLRASLLWTVDIPLASVVKIETPVDVPRGSDVLNAAPGTQAQVLLTLNQACVAQGPFGLKKKVTRVALYVDDPAALLEALRP
jgi:hypothetical protein